MVGKHFYKMEWIAAVLVIVVLLIFGFMSMASKEGRAVGLVKGRLAPCGSKPNCVCSEYPEDKNHFVEPFVIPAQVDSIESLSLLVKNLVTEVGGDVQLESYTYISAIFTSTLWGFVDDFEVRIDMDTREINFRSASRVGQSDLGVNAKRVERFVELLEERIGR
ncbi:DUF1499 domain-containing protein [Neptuniibacter marinus]|mgnify:CR=1 FL=1|uniref:DUF1499 domain-containing protein n=2 Tax=Neptuniibacter marinus TaxID=1806670 RepID=UPI0009EED353|nr:DUF1499 domain-containing protein [Neptuniibacter marinus]